MKRIQGSPARLARLRWVFLGLLIVIMATACAEEPGGDLADAEGENGEDSDSGGGDGDLDSTVGIGTNPTGQAYHTVGSEVSALISNYTPIDASVVPSSGANASMQDIHAGSLGFAVVDTPNVGWAYNGDHNYPEPLSTVRMVLQGSPAKSNGIVARQDSGVERLEDLEGEPVGSDWPGSLITELFIQVGLESVGLSWDDVQQVPMPDLATGADALREGRIVASGGASATTPNIVEAHEATPLRVLPPGNLEPEDIEDGIPSDIQQILDDLVPGTTLSVMEGPNGIIEEDTVMLEFRSAFVAGEHVSNDTVYAVLEALWENDGDLADTHPLGQWVADEFLTENPNAPYHEGAVQFFEDQGVWTDAHQEAQDELLAAAG